MFDKLKKRYQDARKSWMQCSILELVERKEKRRWWSLSYSVSGTIIFFSFFELYLETRVIGLSIIGCIAGLLLLLVGLDLSNDGNRIDMWIYLKTIYGKEEHEG